MAVSVAWEFGIEKKKRKKTHKFSKAPHSFLLAAKSTSFQYVTGRALMDIKHH